MKTLLKVTSLLLSYPTRELQQALPELRAALQGCRANPQHVSLLVRLAEDIASRDLLDAQERYVLLFDRTRSLSLHLFEHVHAESRDRGQAMVDLMAMYDADGFEINARELPDYLPLFLEYLSMKTEAEAAELLEQTAHIIEALRERLRRRGSVYTNAFLVLAAMAARKPDAALLDKLLTAAEDDPDDLTALDRIWEEEVVTFGGNAGEQACGPDRLRMQLRADARKPVDPTRHPNA